MESIEQIINDLIKLLFNQMLPILKLNYNNLFD